MTRTAAQRDQLLDALVKSTADLQAAVAAIDKRLSSAEANIANHEQDIGELTNGYNQLEDRVSALEAPVVIPPPVDPPTTRPFPAPVTTRTVSAPPGSTAAGLNALIAAQPSGTVIDFQSGGSYTLTAGLLLSGKSNIVLNGHGAKLSMMVAGNDEAASAFLLRGSSNIRITDFVVDGGYGGYPTPQGENAHCLGLSGWYGGPPSSFVELDNIRGTRFFGDFVYLEGENVGTQRPSSNVWVHGCTFDYCGRNAVSPINVTDVLIEDNTFGHMAYHVLDCEPNQNAEEIRRVTFRRNTVGEYAARSGLIGFFFSCYSPNNAPIDTVEVSGNTVTGIASDGVNHQPRCLHTAIRGEAAHRYSNIKVTGNLGTRMVAGSGVIYAQNVDGLTVTGNQQPLSSGTLVQTSGCTNAVTSPNP